MNLPQVTTAQATQVVKELTAAVAAGTALSDKVELLQAAEWLSLYAIQLVRGNSSDAIVYGSSEDSVDLEASLESLVSSLDPSYERPMQGIGNGVLIKLLIQRAIEQIIAKIEEEGGVSTIILNIIKDLTS